MNEKNFSDEFLNAFVDDQLAAEEKSRAYEQINADESLNRQVCELRKVRDLVQLAYRDVPGAREVSEDRRRVRLSNIAAGFMLALGLAFVVEVLGAAGQAASIRHLQAGAAPVAGAVAATPGGTQPHANVTAPPAPSVQMPASATSPFGTAGTGHPPAAAGMPQVHANTFAAPAPADPQRLPEAHLQPARQSRER